ncbi:MAG: hypothetical protein K2M95_02425, partial [Clostridiales bacterium]|nr:hypothetical protein [Clostridiales bacterium]
MGKLCSIAGASRRGTGLQGERRYGAKRNRTERGVTVTVQEAKERVREEIERAQNIVFFGGAGVSTESGIPDFRSVDGLYN